MPLNETTIKQARTAKLAQVNTGPVSGATTIMGALVSGQASTTTVPVVTPKPPRAIFSILSWNIQDYKGSKIDGAKGNKTWVHDFIKRLVERLEIDLLILIETDVDLDEAAARIELADHDNFGQSHGPLDRCAFHLVGSDRAFKAVDLPPQFTLADLQTGAQKRTPDEDWVEDMEAFFHCYAVTYQGTRVDYPTLKKAAVASSFNPAQAVFKLVDKCPRCGGSGCTCAGAGTCAYCTCAACGKQHELLLPCSSCVCSACADTHVERVPCTNCGGPTCTLCGGSGAVSAPCSRCGCPDCRKRGTIRVMKLQACPTCNGAKGGMATCPACNGAVVPCGTCQGSRLVPVLCPGCNGAGAVPLVMDIDCQRCGKVGFVPRLPTGAKCSTCNGTRTQLHVCSACAGARCPECEGHKAPGEDALAHALETATDLLKREVFPGYDVETYAALWRTPPTSFPTPYDTGHEASDRKLAWLCNGSSLCSTDKAGVEIGYQDPTGRFNGRSPFTMPLWLGLDGQHVQVPIAVLHALWDSKSLKGKAVEEARGDSVKRMLDLAVEYPPADLEALADFKSPVLVGDFNLHYDASKAKSVGTQTIADFMKKGYRTTTSEHTSLTPLKNGLDKLSKSPNAAGLYSKAYDHFLLKAGSVLDQHVVQAGVIDILDFAQTIIAGTPGLSAIIDQDALSQEAKYDLASSKNPPLARAFYLYRKYVSDHIPILLDILVDTCNVKQAAARAQLLERGQAVKAQMEKAQGGKMIQRYRGSFTAVTFSSAGACFVKSRPGGCTLSGKVIRWRTDTLLVRWEQLVDVEGKQVSIATDFEGTHNIPVEQLKQAKEGGQVWLNGEFDAQTLPVPKPSKLPTGQKATPPAYWTG